jgi:hypothetical protein
MKAWRWEKKGKIFAPEKGYNLIRSHSQIPTALVLEDRIRIYFATRPRPGLSLTTYIDVELNDPKKIIYVHDQPILELGEAGMFDEHGIMPNHVVTINDQIYLYYGGWSKRVSIDYSNWIGLAISTDGGKTLKKKYRGPVVDRTPWEPFSATGIFSLYHENQWHMWYGAGTSWQTVNNKLEHTYEVRSGVSADGINWKRSNQTVLQKKIPNESNYRPSVHRLGDKWHMWFCYRGIEDFRDGRDAYRIGYAWSNDLKRWHREDSLAGIDLSPEGWDSKMMAYPYVVKVQDRLYMFYNGNGFGQSGFGYAELRIS